MSGVFPGESTDRLYADVFTCLNETNGSGTAGGHKA
jgi:hypothetical protein